MEQELNQAGAVEEQPTEDISAEVSKPTSTEEKKTSERTYSDAEWRKMQSMKDQAEAKAQRYEREVQQLRERERQQKIEARQREIAALADEPDEQAKVRLKHQLEDEVENLKRVKEEESGAVGRKYDSAIDLAERYNLSLADAREIFREAETQKEMELLAKLKVAEQKTPTSTEKSIPTPDSGLSDMGGRRSWTADEVANLSSEQYEKYRPEIEEAWRQGRIKQ